MVPPVSFHKQMSVMRELERFGVDVQYLELEVALWHGQRHY